MSKFHLLDHVLEDVTQLEERLFLHTSPFEHFKYIVKQSIRNISNCKATGLNEVMKMTNFTSVSKDCGPLMKQKYSVFS